MGVIRATRNCFFSWISGWRNTTFPLSTRSATEFLSLRSVCVHLSRSSTRRLLYVRGGRGLRVPPGGLGVISGVAPRGGSALSAARHWSCRRRGHDVGVTRLAERRLSPKLTRSSRAFFVVFCRAVSFLSVCFVATVPVFGGRLVGWRRTVAGGKNARAPFPEELSSALFLCICTLSPNVRIHALLVNIFSRIVVICL